MLGRSANSIPKWLSRRGGTVSTGTKASVGLTRSRQSLDLVLKTLSYYHSDEVFLDCLADKEGMRPCAES